MNKNFLHSFPQMSTKEMYDMKRVRGQISCAECRRLKLKCDKKIPCSSCVRRGCKAICPTEIATAQGKRSSDTTGLHTQVETLNRRIRELEDALSRLQSSVSTNSHPLLLNVNQHSTSETSQDSQRNSLHDKSKPMDILGTLSLDKRGTARYLGRSAGLESLLEGGPEIQDTENSGGEDNYLSVPSELIAQLPKYFPFTYDSSWDVGPSLELLLSYLPPKERAWALAENFIEHSLLQIKVVSREELFDELLTPLYLYTSSSDYAGQKCPLSPTRLAVLFICFAHGSLADIGLPVYSAESEDFLNLSRSSLTLHSILSSPDLASVQALTLIGMFHDTGGRSYNIEAAWSFLTIACKLSQSLGLHRESPRWGLDQKMLHRRRTIFWEILTWDAMLSLSLGRPPCFFGGHVDTPLPSDEDAGLDEKGNTESGFHHWRMSFTRDVVTVVSEITLSSDMPSYPTILDLDRRVRAHALPEKYDPLRFLHSALEKNLLNAFDDPIEKQVEHEVPSVTFKGHHLTHLKALVTMFIHRAFFAQALLQSPLNPLSSIYAPSFLATYRAASVVVHLNVKHFYKYFEMLSRYWALWNGILTAGIILGLIVTRCPKSAVAANAYEELGLAVDLFKMGATRSDRSKRGLYVLLQMYEKATNAYESQVKSAKEETNVAEEDADDLHTLEMFAGYTKLLMKDMTENPRAFTDKSCLRNRSPPSDRNIISGSLADSTKERFQADLPVLSGTVMPTTSSYRSDGTDAHNKPDIEYSYPIVPTDHVETVDQSKYFASSSSTPNMYFSERYERSSSKASSQVVYDINSCPLPEQCLAQGEHWIDTRSQNEPVLQREEALNTWTSTFPDSQCLLPGPTMEGSQYSGQPPPAMTVGAMNVRWAELMQDEGFYWYTRSCGSNRG